MDQVTIKLEAHKMSTHVSLESLKNKPKFKSILIIGGKMYESTNHRKWKRDESCKEEKNLGRETKKIKSDAKGKSLVDTPKFAKNGPNMQSQFWPKAAPFPYPKKTRLLE